MQVSFASIFFFCFLLLFARTSVDACDGGSASRKEEGQVAFGHLWCVAETGSGVAVVLLICRKEFCVKHIGKLGEGQQAGQFPRLT